MPTQFSTLLKSPIVLAAFGVVGIIFAGSIAYVLIGTHEPALAYAAVTRGSVAQTVTGTGTVEPVQNPTLTFTSGGRVTSVRATVGQNVGQGTVLATLDTSVLQAQRAAAVAALAKLQAGPRAVDVAGKQTAVTAAQTSFDSAHASFPSAIRSAASAGSLAVAATDPYFRDPNTNPALDSSYDRDFASRTRINDERGTINTTLIALKKDTDDLSSSDSVASLDASAGDTLDHLEKIESFLDDLSAVMSNSSTESITSSSVAAALTSVNTARSQVNASMTALQTARQNLAQGSLAVQSANDTLDQVTAGAQSEDIQAAQAQVQALSAQIAQAEIIAPFAGTVASVSVKPGDVLAPNSAAVTLLPNGTSSVDIYLTEIEIAHLAVGDAADVTLDAYGADRIFKATVGTVEHAPSTPEGATVAGYKVTVVFSEDDPAVAVGMHANVTIHGASVDNVLRVPRTALIEDGLQAYVLKKSGKAIVRTPVTVGLVGTDTAEITSGLSEGDQVAAVGNGS